MVKVRRVPIVIWGHCAPFLQVADRYQNRIFKQTYKMLEAMKIAEMLMQNPNGVPKLTREEVLYLIAKTCKQCLENTDFQKQVRKDFYATGTCIALDGSEDALLDSCLLRYWNE